MTSDDREARARLLKQITEGRLTLRFFELPSPSGAGPRYWSLTCRGPDGADRRLMMGAMDRLVPALKAELGAIAERRAPRPAPERPERSPAQEQRWWPVVRLARTLGRGEAALFEVVKCFPRQAEAHRFQKERARMAAWHAPFDAELPPGRQLVAGYGENRKLDLLIDQSRRRQELRGQYATFGVWHDRGPAPAAGSAVRIVGALDRQGGPRDNRIVPDEGAGPRTRLPARGGPSRPTYVVVRLDAEEPNRGTVELVTEDRSEAVAKKQSIDLLEQGRRAALDPKSWRSPTLQQHP